jgi:hypothetical protein
MSVKQTRLKHLCGCLDAASKMEALAFANVNYTGYLVTSIYLGTLGMGLANPPKARTAATGELLSFLMGLTLLAGDAAFQNIFAAY